ncbi:MAG: Ig domain-containing protein [Oscillospiraceae bacterium]|nr:Ig domain-containing protein [Oscillospiraceae bacterium]
MKRKLSIAAVLLTALLLIVGCMEQPTDDSSVPEEVSSGESVSAEPSAPEESSTVSSEETSSEPDDPSDEPSDDPSDDPVSDDPSEESPGEFSPWREEDEPDLGNLHLPSIPEEGFSFLDRSMTLRMGESATVGYEFKPVGVTNRTLVWSSSDETVVKVESGRLTAVGIGSATVKAVTPAGRSAECRVTVVQAGTLSPLGALAAQLADGNFSGLQFSKYDAELDGTAELFLRRMGENGVPVVTVYRPNGEAVLTLSTGVDEEWAIWRRKAGGRYLLLSYSQPMASGSTRYVLEEITVSDGKPVRKSIFARETAPDGTVTYYHFSGGSLVPCDEAAYRQERSVYFAENRQLPDTVLSWVTGKTAGEVDDALRAIRLPG